jgi:hypothetical protein
VVRAEYVPKVVVSYRFLDAPPSRLVLVIDSLGMDFQLASASRRTAMLCPAYSVTRAGGLGQ